MPPVDEQLDRLAREASRAVRDVVDGEAAPPAGGLTARLRRRRQVRVVAGAAVVLAVVSGVLVGVTRPGSLPVPVIGQDDPSPADEGETPADEGAAEGARECPQSETDHLDVQVDGWEQLAPPPAPRARAGTVWVDGRLLLIGGDTEFAATLHDDVFVYDPATNLWTCTTPAPFASNRGQTAVAERAVFLVGRRQATVFDVDTETWEQLPDPPLSGIPVVAVWTGDRLLVWGSSDRGPASRQGAAYDPDTGRWDPLAEAPAGINVGEGVWTGDELIVVGAQQDHNNLASTDTAQAFGYDPATDRWRRLPETGLSPQHVTAVWNGQQVIAADEHHRAISYDPDTETWDQLDDVPVLWTGGLSSTVLDDGRVLMWDGAHGALLNPTELTWTAIDTPATATHDPDDPIGISGRPTTSDGHVLFAGAAHEGHANRLWRYTPPN